MARVLSLVVSAPYFKTITLGGNGDLHGFFFNRTRYIPGSKDECHNAVYGLDSVGSLKWRFEPTDWCLSSCKHCYQYGENGNIYVMGIGIGPDDNILCALDGEDGSIKWQKQLESVAPPFLANIVRDTVYVCHGARIDALDENGSLKWTSVVRGESCGDFRVGPDGSVVNYGEHTLTMHSPEAGTVKWSLEGLKVDFWHLIEEGVIVSQVSSSNDQVSLSYLRGADGSTAWNISLPVSQDWLPVSQDWSPVRRSLLPVVGSNGEVYVNGLDRDGDGVCTLQVFDMNGSMLRSMPCLPASELQHTALLKDDGTQEDLFVYSVFSQGTNVLAYNGIGELLWNASLPDGLYRDFRFGQDGMVFALESHFYQGAVVKAPKVIAIRNGLEVWREATPGVVRAVLTNDGITYLERGSSVLAVDEKGSQVWSYDASEQIILV